MVGRPNAGKSTLVNAILGEERLLTGPEAGITRDAIAVEADWFGTPFRIFDTAGMRKKAKVQGKLEKLSVSDGLRAVKFAEVVVVLLDVQIPFETQDLRIADLAEREGRAVVVAVNKWDLEEEKPQKLNELREAFGRLLPQLRGRADGDGLGADRQGARPAARGDRQGLRGLEHKDFDGAAEPVARRADRRASAAGAGRAADPAALHDPGEDAAADLRALRLDRRTRCRRTTSAFWSTGCGATSTCRARRSGSTCAPGENPYAGRRKPNVTSLDKHKPRRLEGLTRACAQLARAG